MGARARYFLNGRCDSAIADPMRDDRIALGQWLANEQIDFAVRVLAFGRDDRAHRTHEVAAVPEYVLIVKPLRCLRTAIPDR